MRTIHALLISAALVAGPVALSPAGAESDGNAAAHAKGDEQIVAALKARADDASDMVREHVAWALAQHA